MRVVVTGATGNIGVPLVRALFARGHDVVGLARRPPRSDDAPEVGGGLDGPATERRGRTESTVPGSPAGSMGPGSPPEPNATGRPTGSSPSDAPAESARPVASRPAAARVRWCAADLSTPHGLGVLREALAGADAFVHLAWPLQPMRSRDYLHRAGPETMPACVAAALDAGVERIVHLSSVAVYRPASHDVRIDESWPLGGVATSTYARHKVEGSTASRPFSPSGAPRPASPSCVRRS